MNIESFDNAIAREQIDDMKFSTEDDRGNSSGIVYESSSSRIMCCHINVDEMENVEFVPNLEGGRVEVAIKSLTNSHPSHGDLSYLNNEYHILTKHLAHCKSSLRKAIGRSVPKPLCKNPISEVNGSISQPPNIQHAIYLEWIEGTTLDAFIKNLQVGEKGSKISESGNCSALCPTYDLIILLVMHKIALALADIHEAGVIHNDIAADNIIVHFNTGGGGDGKKVNDLSVHIIDFGYAITVTMAETDDSGESINDDLYNLGVVYREILLAAYPSDSVESSLRGGSLRCIRDNILSDSTPRPLHSVVSCLTHCESDDASSNPPYKSAKEVVEDLEQMIDNPEIFLYENHKKKNISHHLLFKPDALYGRSEEVKKILNAYNQMRDTRNARNKDKRMCPDMILVTGYGGCGKTSLVKSLKDPVTESGGYFISGKFDAIQMNEPYTALIKALSDYCSFILASSDNVIETMKNNIMSAVGSEATILIDLIPNLSKIVTGSNKEGNQDEGPNIFTSGLKEQNKLHFTFRRFMRSVATREHPLVMVLDDLQWADTASLNLIQSIVTDSENKSPLLLVGCYRDNEVLEGHPLLRTIHEIERLKFASTSKKIEAIKIDSLKREDITFMISDALLIKRRVARNMLADLVYQKTQGNALFTIQFLKSLVEDGLLCFDSESCRWNWDGEGIHRIDVSDSVGDLLTQKIRTQLTENARNTLRLASCIGSMFEVEILAMLLGVAENGLLCRGPDQYEGQNHCDDLATRCANISKTLNQLVCEGLLEKDGPKAQLFRFSHDRIYQAAYACISADERSSIHLCIGELMQNMLSHPKKHQERLEDGNSKLFRMTDQLNRGSHLLTDESKKIALVDLNLKVGEICMKKSAFQTALSYLDAGIRLIDRDTSWQKHYSLVLRLHNITAEAQYCTGNLNDIPKLLEDVFAHAKSNEDKLNAYSTQMLVLGAQIRVKDALSVGLGALAIVGEYFPTSISKGTILTELMRTKWILRKKKVADLLGLPPMTDKIKITAMQFLSTIFLDCLIAKPLLLPLLICRMIRLTVSHGICEASAFSFASFGYILCDRLFLVKEGYKYGQVALSMAKRYGGNEWLPKVYVAVYSAINYWSENLSLGTQAYFDGYKIGMEVGDIDYASSCAIMHLRYLLFCGEPLDLAERRARKFSHQFAEYNHDLGLRMCVSVWQTMLNLLGKAENPEKLDGEAIEFGTSQNPDLSQYKEFDEAIFSFFEMYVAYMFGMSTTAAEKSKAIKKLLCETSQRFRGCMKYNIIFYDGLNNVDMAMMTKENIWRIEAKRNMKELKRAAKISPQNHLFMHELINAGYATLKGKNKEAAKLYDSAVAAAAKTGFCHYEALAYEKAGMFFKKEGCMQKSTQYFVNAHQSYLKWGAKAKADHLYNQWTHE